MQYARDDVRYLHRLRLLLASALAEEDLMHVFDLLRNLSRKSLNRSDFSNLLFLLF
jgi:ribonuclease D